MLNPSLSLTTIVFHIYHLENMDAHLQAEMAESIITVAAKRKKSVCFYLVPKYPVRIIHEMAWKLNCFTHQALDSTEDTLLLTVFPCDEE
jgi:hypothetical protein